MNNRPIPMGQVASLPNGNFMVHAAGGRQYGLRPNGRLAFFSANGHNATFRGNGQINFLHTPTMDIMHGGRGQRTIAMRRADNSLLVSTGRNAGFLERSILFHGRTFRQRRCVLGDRVFTHLFVPYTFHGVILDHFVPTHRFDPVVYAWAFQPWQQPAWYAWPWKRDPWYGRYQSYYTPQSSYASPSDWLTDYYLSQTMADGYAAQPADDNTTDNSASESSTGIYDTNAAYPGTRELMKIPKRSDASTAPGSDSGTSVTPDGGNTNPESNSQTAADDDPLAQEDTPITPELKKQIAEQVQQELEYEKAASAQPGADDTGDLPNVLEPNHVFVVNVALSATTADQKTCSLSVGDALQLVAVPPEGATTADLTVASGLKADCPSGTQVTLPLEAVQEMQNNFRERVAAGLQALQGPTGLPPAPKAAEIPSPDLPPSNTPANDADVQALLQSEQQEADHAESKVSQAAFASGG